MSLYTDLGVEPDASPEAIKARFRAISKTLHPDVGGRAEAFANVSAAYDILKDPEKRARYDATGETTRKTEHGDAMEHISMAMAELVHKYPGNLTQIDMARALRESISIPLEQINMRIAAAEAEASKIEERIKSLQGRFSTKDANNVIDGVLRAQLGLSARGRQGIEQMKEQRKSFELALEILKDYDFRADPAPPQPRGFTFMQSSDYGLSPL